MNIITLPNYEEISLTCANHIAGHIRASPDSLMCFAAGDTTLGVFKELIKLQMEDRVDLSSVYYIGLDEWVDLGYEDVGSCKQVMFDSFYFPANIPAHRISVFDGKNTDYGEQVQRALDFISDHGGISLTVLGIGMNGHIGFNEPGVDASFSAGVVTLDNVTRTVGKKYFHQPYLIEFGITIGIKSLVEAKEVVLIANGARKAKIIHKALCGNKNNSIPASHLSNHPALTVYLDTDAASQL